MFEPHMKSIEHKDTLSPQRGLNTFCNGVVVAPQDYRLFLNTVVR